MILKIISILLFANWVHAAVIDPIPVDDGFFVQKTKSNEIKIMTYNAYNLFDTVHDDGAFDYTFLPIDFPGKAEKCSSMEDGVYKDQCEHIDWTPDKLQKKIGQIVHVLTAHGSKPDLIALEEVENANVVGMLAKAAGYSQFLVTDYGNHRGVDVAIMYNDKKLTLLEQSYVKTPGRDPYRLKFRNKSTKDDFYVYINHWFAQSAPVKYRIETAEQLRADIDELIKKDPKARIIAMGDFNVVDKEEDIVMGDILFDDEWSNRLFDVHQLSRQQFPKYASKFPNGSYFFGGKTEKIWRRFDRFLVSKNLLLNKKPAINVESFRVVYSSFLTTPYQYKVNEDDPNSDEIIVRYPIKYNFLDKPEWKLGYSDHLPLSMIVAF